jgi:hypothetical protein
MTVLEADILTPGEEAPDLGLDPGPECPKCGRSFKNTKGLGRHVTSCKGATPVTPDLVTPPKPPLTPRQKRPALPPGKRQDASSVLGYVYSTVANFIPSAPAQRAMQWQAPSAGRILDDAVAGTFIDKQIVQRIAGAGNKIEPVFNLLSLPIICYMIDKQPALGQMLYPVARKVMEGNLASILKQMKRDKDERLSLEAEARAVGLEWEQEMTDPETGKVVKVDIIDSVLSQLFQTAPEPEAADAPAQG